MYLAPCIAVAKARLALERGAVDEAAKLLAQVPTEGASARIVERRFQPLMDQAEKLVAARDELQKAVVDPNENHVRGTWSALLSLDKLALVAVPVLVFVGCGLASSAKCVHLLADLVQAVENTAGQFECAGEVQFLPLDHHRADLEQRLDDIIHGHVVDSFVIRVGHRLGVG